jgi:hypothetical protein
MFNMNEKLDEIVKLMLCAAAVAAACIASLFFFCVALFMWTQQQFGTLTASLILGAVFLLAALVALITGEIVHRRAAARAPEPREQKATWWTEPAVLTTALEVVRAIGSRRLTTALLGAFVVGALLSQQGEQQGASVQKPQT